MNNCPTVPIKTEHHCSFWHNCGIFVSIWFSWTVLIPNKWWVPSKLCKLSNMDVVLICTIPVSIWMRWDVCMTAGLQRAHMPFALKQISRRGLTKGLFNNTYFLVLGLERSIGTSNCVMTKSFRFALWSWTPSSPREIFTQNLNCWHSSCVFFLVSLFRWRPNAGMRTSRQCTKMAALWKVEQFASGDTEDSGKYFQICFFCALGGVFLPARSVFFICTFIDGLGDDLAVTESAMFLSLPVKACYQEMS